MSQVEEAAERAVEELREDADTPAVVDPHEDRTREMKTPGFSRMRVEWSGEDGAIISSIMSIVDNRIMEKFVDAYQIMSEIYDVVREPEYDPDNGEMIRDRFGFPVWRRTVSGAFVEDWSSLGIRDRELFVFQITTRLFEWEQLAADAWGEAMFAKGKWEEAFAESFIGATGTGRLTDEARTQRGRQGSREDRYFAIFQSLYSRKADAIVRTMERLGLRLSQGLPK